MGGAAVSVVSSFAGQTLIPVLVLGTVLGNTAGTIFYQIVEGVFLKLHFSIGRTVRSEYILEITEMIRKCALRRFC